MDSERDLGALNRPGRQRDNQCIFFVIKNGSRDAGLQVVDVANEGLGEV